MAAKHRIGRSRSTSASTGSMEESTEQIESAIAALQAQRAVLGEAVVAMAVAPLQEKLAARREREGATQQLKTATVLFMDVVGSTRLVLEARLALSTIHAEMDFIWQQSKRATPAEIVEQHKPHFVHFRRHE